MSEISLNNHTHTVSQIVDIGTITSSSGSGGKRLFTANGTFVVPQTGTYYITISGGGGAGGGGNYGYNAGMEYYAGGGGGCLISMFLDNYGGGGDGGNALGQAGTI